MTLKDENGLEDYM